MRTGSSTTANEAAASNTDVDTTTVDVPSEAAERPEWHSLYDVVLGQLKDVISPRITDGFALQRTKGAARIIRHLQAIDLHGRTFADAELADLAGVLGARPSGVGASRRELAERVHAGTIDAATALGTVARRVARDEELLRSASGVLPTRHYDPLTRFNP